MLSLFKILQSAVESFHAYLHTQFHRILYDLIGFSRILKDPVRFHMILSIIL